MTKVQSSRSGLGWALCFWSPLKLDRAPKRKIHLNQPWTFRGFHSLASFQGGYPFLSIVIVQYKTTRAPKAWRTFLPRFGGAQLRTNTEKRMETSRGCCVQQQQKKSKSAFFGFLPISSLLPLVSSQEKNRGSRTSGTVYSLGLLWMILASHGFTGGKGARWQSGTWGKILGTWMFQEVRING